MKKRNTLLLCIFMVIITFSINVYADCGPVATFVAQMNEHVYMPIKWGTPLLLLVLTSFDFAKVVFSGDQKGMDKAKNNFLKRSIAALIVFFAPDIITTLATLINNEDISSCLTVLM